MPGSPWWRGVAAATPMAPGIASAGILYGATASDAGMPSWSVVGSSLLIATGTAQFMAVELLAQGVGWWLVVLLGLLVNLRFAVYALHLSPFAGHLPPLQRIVYFALVNDEGYALTTSRWSGAGPGQGKDLRWSLAVMFVVWLAWQVGTVLGTVAGDFLPASLGLEMAVPITLLTVLVLLAGTYRHLQVAAIAGAAGLLLRGAPNGLGLLAGVAVGVSAGLVLSRKAGRVREIREP